jgi:hypothetical protein
MEHTSSFLPALFQKRPLISVLSVVMIVLTLGVSVAFTRLYSAHAANALTWSSDTQIKQSSGRFPAMTAFNGKLYAAYVVYVDPDVSSIDRLYVTTSSDGITWSDGIFTNQRTLVRVGKRTVNMSATLAVYNNTLYMAYVASDGSQLMIASSSDGTTWSDGIPVPNIKTAEKTPSLAVYNNKLYVAFIADGGSDIVFIASYDGTNWSGASQVSNSSVTQYSGTAPSLAAFNNKLYVAFLADNSSGDVLIASYDGANWSNDTNTGQVSQAAPTLTVFQDQLYIAFADNGLNDHLLYASSSDGTNWSASTWVPNQYTHKTPALAVLNSKLYITFIADNESNDLLVVSGS